VLILRSRLLVLLRARRGEQRATSNNPFVFSANALHGFFGRSFETQPLTSHLSRASVFLIDF
jgi:hypothetical protein